MNLRIARRLAEQDPVLGRVIARATPVSHLKPRRLPPYQSLVKAVVYQQLSGNAADTIFARFCALFPGTAFPEAHEVLMADTARLRSAGLSRAKADYVRNLAQHTVEGGVPSLEDCDRLTDAELIARLTEIKGVGRWTVEMMLIFNLGRPDVLPVHDLGVRRGFQRAFGRRQLPSPRHLERIGRRWAPHRTTAAWYLWRATEPGVVSSTS